MITNYWIEKGISALLLVLLVVLGYLSFGYPVYFDRLFIVLLIGCVALYRIDINLASIGVILLLVRLLSEGFFAYRGDYEDVFFYALSLIVVYKFRFDQQVKFVLFPTIILCCFAELYWHFVEYEAPQLGAYVVGIALNCLLRVLLMSRVHLTDKFPNLKLSSITLDYDLYRIITVYNSIIVLMISEYLIRHLTPWNPLFVYEIYSYCLQIITLYFPYLVVSYLIKSRFKIYA